MEFDGSALMNCTSNIEPDKKGEVSYCPMTLHCQHCNTVLGDASGICGEIKCLESIICLKVTGDVVVCDLVRSSHKEGPMACCIYSPLKCGCCSTPLGNVIHSSPPSLNMLRSFFLLNKTNISCYILKSSSMVKATAFEFNQEPMREGLKEVNQKFEEYLDRMVHIKSQLVSRKRIYKKKK